MKRAAAIGDSPNRITLPARRRRRRGGRGARDLPRRAEPAIRHGARRRHASTSATPTASSPSPTPTAPRGSPAPAGRSPTLKPGGHWTRSILPSADGRRLYVGVGSLSNIGDHGMAAEEGRAAIWEVDLAAGTARVFASGLRNPVGLAWEPHRHALDRGQRARRARRRDAARLSDLGLGTAASTAGPGATGADGGRRGCRRTRRWSRRRSGPTTRSAGTPPRSASAGCRPARCPASPRAWRSASTARGTAASSAATR